MSNENTPHEEQNRPAVGGPVERMVGRPVEQRADDGGHDLGAHWLGGKPYMLRWVPPAPTQPVKRTKAK